MPSRVGPSAMTKMRRTTGAASASSASFCIRLPSAALAGVGVYLRAAPLLCEGRDPDRLGPNRFCGCLNERKLRYSLSFVEFTPMRDAELRSISINDARYDRMETDMASQWGTNSLAPNQSAGWFFVRNEQEGFLPVLQVMPLSPSFTNQDWTLTDGGYPYFNQLGISTTWSQLTDDLKNLVYFMVVQNNSSNTIEYAFLESDL
jgi:hypothetical protein